MECKRGLAIKGMHGVAPSDWSRFYQGNMQTQCSETMVLFKWRHSFSSETIVLYEGTVVSCENGSAEHLPHQKATRL